MKRRLRCRFVLIALAALIVLESAIVAFSIGSSYLQMTTTADRLILLAGTDPDASALADARYFSVTYVPHEKTVQTELSHAPEMRTPDAVALAKEIIASRQERGYIDHYRYLVHRGKSGIHITFLARAAALDAFQSNARSLLIVSAAGLCVMAVVLVLISGKVVAPLVKNHERQKEFITSASHELKTPLTVIHADAQLLESEIGENEWLTDIIRQTTSMTEMTHRLVTLARAEEENDHFVRIDFPISDVVSDVAEPYRAVAQSSGKTYTLDIQDGLSYHGDENAIRELVTALLDNAFKYSPARGSIHVCLAASGRHLRFSVENSVTNIDAQETQHFTERFYRKNTSDSIKGFGIGLSLAQSVAEAHKGKLSITLPEKDRIQISATLK